MRLAVLLVGCLSSVLSCDLAARKQLPKPTPAVAKSALPPAGPDKIGWVLLEREHPAQIDLTSVKPDDLPAHIAAIYRVNPDRRVLYAIAEIARVASPREKATLSLAFTDGFWNVRLDGVEVGQLPEIPNYGSSKQLLLSWARRQKVSAAAPGPSTLVSSDLARDLSSGSNREVISALAQLNGLWKAHPGQPELLAAAARGTIWLLAQTYDQLQLSDPLAGKALALLILAESAGVPSLQREEALLCTLMGYEAAALPLVANLPADDAVRALAINDVKDIRRLLKRTSDPRSQYLLLISMADPLHKLDWYPSFDATSWAGRIDLSSLRLGVALHDFSTVHQLASAMTLEAFREAADASTLSRPANQAQVGGGIAALLDGSAEQTGTPLEPNLPKFESAVRARAASLQGPLLDRESIEAFYFAPAYSAVYETARYYFDSLGTTDGAEGYLRSFGETPGGTAAELKRWIANRIAIRRGKANILKVAMETFDSRSIGIAPLARVVLSIGISTTSGTDPAVREPMKFYFERLDARPSNLAEVAHIFGWKLLDLPRYEKFARAAAEAVPRGADAETWALRSADKAALRRIASDLSLPVARRASALRDLEQLGDGDRAFLDKQYRALIEEEPENLEIVESYVKVLEKRDDLEHACRVVRQWRSTRKGRDLTWVAATAVEARLLQRRGRLAEAWTTIGPVLSSGKADAFLRGVSILAAQGRLDQALELATACVERYPEGGESQASLAEVLWRLGRHADAAEALLRSQALNPRWSTSAKDAFARAFNSGRDAEAEAAFDALCAQPLVPRQLADLAISVASGKPGLAFRLLSKLKATGPDGNLLKIWAYDQLKKTEGEEKAVAWLRTNLSANPATFLHLFQQQRYELLWTLFPDHVDERPIKVEQLQILRVAALLLMHKESDPRREALIAYFEGRPRDYFAVSAFYLLGKADRREIYKEAKNIDYLTHVAWVVALKAASDRHYTEASDWFQVTLETGRNQIPPHAWAYETLLRWFNTGKLVSTIQSEGVL